METLGVYIQVPFCSSKCSFCNFSSEVMRVKVIKSYARTLEQEISLLPCLSRQRPAVRDLLELPLDTVYVGGGTPTLFGRAGLERLFVALRQRFRFAADPEVTLEMTPGSADFELLSACQDLGVSRLSVGAQSFADRELASVGRLHSAGDTVEQLRLARRAGFRNISLDLIAGLPHQTGASWQRSLRQALAAAPEHFSVYLFEVDEKSRLGAEVLRHGVRYHAQAVPDQDFMAEAYEWARESLSRQGYVQYEISNFARPGWESRHNQKYWRREPYLGLGAGAHSFDGLSRWANETSPEVYAKRVAAGELPISEWRTLPEVEQLEEFFFLGLRQRDGVNLESASARWGRPSVERWEPRIAALLHEGWLEGQGSHIRLAPKAYLVSNEVFQEFLS